MWWWCASALGGTEMGEAGPPPSHTPALQRRWSEGPAAVAARSQLGPWSIRWDERNGTPRLWTGPGLGWDRSDEILAQVAAVAGIRPSDLVFESIRTNGAYTGARYRQVYRGAPVEHGTVDLVAKDGRVTYVLSELQRVRLDGEPLPGEWVFPRDDGTFRWARRVEDETEVAWIGRDGATVHRWSRVSHLDVSHVERTAGDPLVWSPARDVLVSDGVTTEATDALTGATSLTGPLDVTFFGDRFRVGLSGAGDAAVVPGVADGVVDSDVDVSGSVTAAHAFVWRVHDWLEAASPEHPFLDAKVTLVVDGPNTCNASLVGTLMSFAGPGGGCPSIARISDIVFHEYGHGIHAAGLVAGTYAQAVSEGSGDYISATIHDDPVVGIGFWGPGTYVRQIETDKVFPDDWSDDAHQAGRIWGGFFWDVREALIARDGYDAGVATADRLLIDTLKLGPGMTEFDAVLLADDDDGDLSDGTPNDCLLLEQGALHGIAPDPFDGVSVQILEGGDLPSPSPDDPPARIRFALTGSEACWDLDRASVRLHYAVEPRASSLDDIPFTEVAPADDGETYTARIPQVPAGSRVVYYVSWADTDGDRTAVSHDGTPGSLYQYWTGDQADLWCEDFEGGAGEWRKVGDFQIGPPPADRPTGATSAVSGTSILGENLTSGGSYGPNQTHWVFPPLLDVRAAGRSMLFLTFQRWLALADGDVADVRESTVGALWQSPAGRVLDREWLPEAVDLQAALDAGLDEVELAFTLTADGAVEYDGWSLDDVCLRGLADLPDHYRRAGLTAEREGRRVTVRWRNPFVRPLAATRLVRKQGGVPTGPDDGEELYEDADPEPGAAASYVDRTDQGWTYALFASDGDGRWYDAALDENAAAVEAAQGDAEGCGCETSGGSAWAWLALAAALLRRRR